MSDVETVEDWVDALDRLARVLYGRKAAPKDYVGGSNANIFDDAARRISAADTRAALWERLAGEHIEMLKVANATIDAMAKELADLKEKR